MHILTRNEPAPVSLALQRSNLIIANPDAPQPISEQLAGETIERVLATGEFLLIRCESGLEFRISWRDETGKRVGTPYPEEVRRFK